MLDKFHMQKYIIAATSHLLDSADDARSELYHAIHKRAEWMAEDTFEKILQVTKVESQRRKVETSRPYLLGHWDGIMQGIQNKEAQVGCSAEGHVSHIYADRMCSRPLGWSKKGVHQMSKLRIFRANQGNMLELVRMQKQELAVPTLVEEEQRYVERMTHSIAFPKIKKIACFKNHIWGL